VFLFFGCRCVGFDFPVGAILGVFVFLTIYFSAFVCSLGGGFLIAHISVTQLYFGYFLMYMPLKKCKFESAISYLYLRCVISIIWQKK
jgi:hypothetical protein